MPLIRITSAEQVPAARQDTKDVLIALATGGSDERRAAARSAAELPEGADVLGKAFSRESDPRVREAILSGLVRLRSPESVLALLPHLRSDDANLRTGALDALRAMADIVAPHLPALLADRDADVRLLACELARSLANAEATRLLCEVLGVEREGNVAAAAVEVIAEIGSPDALPVLARCADRFRGDPFLDFAIKIASERIGAALPPPRD